MGGNAGLLRCGGWDGEIKRERPVFRDRRHQDHDDLRRSALDRDDGLFSIGGAESYSITSSACARIAGGTVMPRAFAVFRFTTNLL
jgi:hypothetical protein